MAGLRVRDRHVSARSSFLTSPAAGCGSMEASPVPPLGGRQPDDCTRCDLIAEILGPPLASWNTKRKPPASTNKGTNQMAGWTSPTVRYVIAHAEVANPAAGNTDQPTRPTGPDRLAAQK